MFQSLSWRLIYLSLVHVHIDTLCPIELLFDLYLLLWFHFFWSHFNLLFLIWRCLFYLADKLGLRNIASILPLFDLGSAEITPRVIHWAQSAAFLDRVWSGQSFLFSSDVNSSPLIHILERLHRVSIETVLDTDVLNFGLSLAIGCVDRPLVLDLGHELFYCDWHGWVDHHAEGFVLVGGDGLAAFDDEVGVLGLTRLRRRQVPIHPLTLFNRRQCRLIPKQSLRVRNSRYRIILRHNRRPSQPNPFLPILVVSLFCRNLQILPRMLQPIRLNYMLLLVNRLANITTLHTDYTRFARDAENASIMG